MERIYKKRRWCSISYYTVSSAAVLLFISNNPFLHNVVASPGGINLPPPPPPPPPLQQNVKPSIFDKIITEKDDRDNSILMSKPQLALDDSSSSVEKLLGSENEDDAPSNKATVVNRITDDDDKGDDVLKPITEANADSDSMWSSSSVGGDDMSQNKQPNEQQSWQQTSSYEQQSGQYHNQQQWQQQQPPSQQSWGKDHYSQYNRHRHDQYGQQTYQSQYQNTQPYQQQQKPGQVALYQQRPSQQRSSSASSLFSLAVNKLQTSVETISDTVDTISDRIVDPNKLNNVVSSVSSLTSKIGSTIGSTVKNGNSGSAGNNRGNIHRGPQRRPPMNNGRVGPGGQRQQHHPMQRQQGQQYPQQMPPPNNQRPQQPMPRRAVQREEVYAPPISELYSLGQPEEDESDDENKDDQHDIDSSDEEDEVEMPFADMMNQQGQSNTYSNSLQTRPSIVETPQARTSIPPQQPRQSSSTTPQQRPRNANTPNTRQRYPTYDDDDDDYYSSSIGSKVSGALGALIPPVPKLFKRSSMSNFDDGSWSDDESKERIRIKSASLTRGSRGSSIGIKSSVIPKPVQSLMEKRETLLSTTSIRKCKSIGRSQAILDAAQLALIICALREIIPIFFKAMSSSSLTETTFGGGIRLAIVSTILSSLDGWSPYALVAVFLLSVSNKVWIQPTLKTVYDDAASENLADSAYSRLYLRLISAVPLSKSFSSEVMTKMTKAHALHIASLARLRSFVTMAIIYILLSTVAVLRPASISIVNAIIEVIQLSSWRVSPLDWHVILEGVKNVGIDLASSLSALFGTELDIIRQQPQRVAIAVSLLTALMFVRYLPSIEKQISNGKVRKINEENEDEDEENDTITSLWSNIGTSSATRLGILSSPRGVEGALSQFTKLRPYSAAAAGLLTSRRKKRSGSELNMRSSFQSLLKKLLYSASSLVILSVPLSIYVYLYASSTQVEDDSTLSVKSIPEQGWVSLLEMAMLLVFTQLQVGTAVNDAIQANSIRLGKSVSLFFGKLLNVVNEVQKLAAEASSGADLQAMLTARSDKGIKVTDLWASHSTRRAWATKGANLQCRNGEVVLIIGADGSGKTRLLTTIAEHIFAPPAEARTTTYVRGEINVAGVDLSKWDRNQLQKRVGVFLNDIRTDCDYASLYSGCTLDEIIEPVPPSGRIGPKERNAVTLAMKITGLEQLLSRLPSKLSTVVTANEDELKPSPLRPPAYPLSPSDWSRVILTKILAQLIAGNENQLSSPDTIRKCLIGSILLLDDSASQMSEIDQAKMITSLRTTGAAVLLSSNQWATGRFVDRIVVIDGGSVVESGTHNDLLSLGPQRSVYARKWSEM